MKLPHLLAPLVLFALGHASASAAEWQTSYSDLLGRYVKTSGVDYAAWHASEADMKALDEVAAGIASESPSGSRDEKLAWYLNAYNALILDEVLERYPYSNENALKRNAFFGRDSIEVAGKTMSFNHLEHEIIRPTFNDPRVHFALNCASVSCPPLLDHAYTAASLDAELTAQTKAFLGGENEEGLQVNRNGKTVSVTQLFQWFSEDFGDVRAFINRYRDEPLPEGAKIDYLKYDWALNEA